MSRIFNLDHLIKLTHQKTIFPFYHIVADETPVHIRNLYQARTVEEFKADLDFLLKHYEPISLKELIADVCKNKSPQKNRFHLTFDDGLAEIYTMVAPILKERNIPATFFISTDFIDNKAMFYRFKASILAERFSAKGVLDVSFKEAYKIDDLAEVLEFNFNDYLIKEEPYLTTGQIQELIDQGFTIGAHSLNHPLYRSISLEEQVNQTLKSIDYLTNEFKLDYKVFSFPFTDDGVGSTFFSKIKKEVDLTFGTAGLKADSIPFNIQRIPMEKPLSGENLIKGEYVYYLVKKIVRKNKIKRR